MQKWTSRALRVGAVIAAIGSSATTARAHCDTMDGPVVRAAQQALATRNVNLVLLWVRQTDEALIRRAFQQTLTVRQHGDAARELADYWFFETLVRVHREGEGAPYTGLKPAGSTEHPAVAAADRSLQAGAVDEVERVVLHAVRDGIRERFSEAMARKRFDANDVNAGREFVRAYVPFLHYVEGIYDAARHSGGEAETPARPDAHHPKVPRSP